ncbi:hypothetical protein V172_12475 [Citrobacter freundii RLS1]|nr:hypothetical protein V172_12475 [Citrobacter freundii RLS1]
MNTDTHLAQFGILFDYAIVEILKACTQLGWQEAGWLQLMKIRKIFHANFLKPDYISIHK